jgi:glycosyltransferase involved in cell wall biosynthesis
VQVLFGPEVFGQRYGGISRYVVELHKRLPGHGFDSTVLAGLHQNAYVGGVAGVRGLQVPRRLQRERLRPVREAVNDALATAALRRRGTSTVYHQTYYQGRAGARHRGPHVVSAYDLVHARFPEHFPPDDATVAQQRTAFGAADLILAISATTKADLVDLFGIDPERVTVTHLGVSPPVGGSHGAGVAEPYLLYVGQRFGYKNWARLVRAFAASGLSRELLLVCTGPPFSAAEEQLVAGLGLAGRVVHRGADDAQLDALYREATAFVYPSLYEGFGLPPLEAMVRDCPVVASASGSVPEVLGDAAVLVDPTDVDAIAAGLVAVSRPDARVELVTRGRQRAERFTWEATAAATAAAYRRLT